MKDASKMAYLLSKITWPKKYVFLSVLILSVSSIGSLVAPLLTGNIVNSFLNRDFLMREIVALVLVYILINVISGVNLFLLNKIGASLIFGIREYVFSHILYLKMKFFNKNDSSQLLSRITNDTNEINDFVSKEVPEILPSIITLLGSLIMMFVLDWKMSICALVIIPSIALLMFFIGNSIQKIAVKMQDEKAVFSGLVGQTLSGMKLVKISNRENDEFSKVKQSLYNIYRLGIRYSKIEAVLQPVSNFIVVLFIGIILFIGYLRVKSGSLSSGSLVTLLFYLVQLIAPINKLGTLITGYKRSEGACERLFDILKEDKETRVYSNKVPKLTKNIVFKNVSFKYNSRYVLEKLNFTIPSGKTTAIVGPSGSGKSTILNIIARMYDDYEGEIFYGEKPITSFDLTNWRSKIGLVLQENTLVNGTIRDNLLYSCKEQLSDKKIMNYLKLGNCYDFIMSFKKKLDTIVGERGNFLSGGQKQRIDITRNLIKNPDILMLDEATANLDNESERKVQGALTTLMKNRTTIVVAHKLSTIKDADQIIFVDGGHVTGVGTHRQLLGNHKKYRLFYANEEF